MTTRVISIGQSLASSPDQAMDSDTEEDVPMEAKSSSKPKARRVTSKNRERAGVKSLDLRRPVRPVDRQKMCPWLKNHLDSNSVFGLSWLKKEEGTFQVSWRHASRLEWNLQTDGDVFEKWARHTGIYKDGDEPEPKRWKANFRCAMHSLPDVTEITNPLERRGRNAIRIYRFMKPNEIGTGVKRKASQTPVPAPRHREHSASEVSEDSGSQHADSDETERITDDDGQYREIIVFPQSDHDYAVKFGQIGNNSPTKILKEHGSGYVLINTESVPNMPTTVEEALDSSQLSVGKRQSEITRSLSSAARIDTGKKALFLTKKKDIRGKGAGAKKVNASEMQRNLVINSRLKDLLARKTAAGSKPLMGVDEVGPLNSGSRTGLLAPSENGDKTTESQTGSPAQAHGFEALLKAVDIARMDTFTSVDDSAMTSSNTAALSSLGVSAPSLAPSVPATISQTVGAHTVCQAFYSTSVPSFTSAAPVSTSDFISALQSHSETTVSPSPAATSVPESFVFSLVPSMFITPVCTTSAAGSSGMLPSTSAVQKKDGSLSSTSASHVTQHISGMHPEESTAAGVSDSYRVYSPNSWNDKLKSLIGMRRPQNASPTVPCTSGVDSFTVSVSPQNNSTTTSVESCSEQSSLLAASEVKSETFFPSVTVVKQELPAEEKVCRTVKDCEQHSSQEASYLEVKQEFPCKLEASVEDHLDSKPSSDFGITPPTIHSALLQSKDGIQVSEFCISQVSVAAPSAASPSLQAFSTGPQASIHSSQTVNVQPASLVLALPQISLPTSQQEHASTITTLPLVGNLHGIFNLLTAARNNADINSNNQ